MNSITTSSSPLAPWQSGRLASPSLRPGQRERVERWITVVLLAVSALVLAAFVDVVQQDVQHSELARARQHQAAVASAGCEDEDDDTKAAADCRSTATATSTADADAAADATDGAPPAP